jgi:hypothetical protein
MLKRISQISVIILLIVLFSFVVWAAKRKEVYREVDLKEEKSLRVRIEFGAGELNLNRSDSEKIVEAEVSYDPAYADFFFDYEKSKEKGELFLGTELEEEKGVNLGDVTEKNWWDLSFTDRIPIDFEIDVGAAESELDFTGLRIMDLDLDIGAAKGLIQFRKPNPERISLFNIDVGASKLEMEGLGNANFKRMNFDGGVGDFTLDFSGDLNHQAFVEIDMGLGRLTILVPEDIGVRIESDGSFLSSISFDQGVFEEVEEDVWINDEYGKTEGELNFNIEVGLGTVDIETID